MTSTSQEHDAAPAPPSAQPGVRAAFTRVWTPRLVAFGEFIDGYDLLVMGAALLFLKPAFALTSFEVGWLGAIAFIGTAVGLVVFGDLSDRFGRKVIFVVNLVFFVVASVASAFVTEVWQLMIARFLIGVAVGMDIPTSHAFLAEIAPKARRGRVAGSLPNLMWLGGAMTSVVIALALRPLTGQDTWRWLFGLAAVPALGVLIARQFLPESPRWLKAQGRHEDAKAVFEALGVEEPGTAVAHGTRSYRDLFTRRAAIRLAAVTCFFALQSFGGAVATVAGPLVIESTGIGTGNSLYFSLAGFAVGFVAVALGATVIDRINRRALGIRACLGVFAAGVVLGLFGGRSSVVLLIAYVAYSFLTWFGPGVLAWVWSSEAFPTQVRGLGSGIAQAVTRLMIALNVVLVPTLLDRFGLRTIVLYACSYLVCALIVALSPFLATSGRELEEIHAQRPVKT
ncbi:MFS transporter [Streptomyces rubradiris]|uniref:MFS transporter n=1 Tax=Streptomyces rubradiris TaxID=285531 RepID=A0ABQ3R8T2_STRRR|nr:MFS transporter [Streptomyces rubradiris]GHH29892.1 MFS transporter [Streptomyces rubradiris]GHI52248.1 MFS transporter [Streptomyces rubradiris]